MIFHHYQGRFVTNLCKITDSTYFVGFGNKDLIVFKETTKTELFKLDHRVSLIKRVPLTKFYIARVEERGVKLLKINNFEKMQTSLHDLFDANHDFPNAQSLDLNYNSSKLIIAASDKCIVKLREVNFKE